jgi:hypothetical protein
MGARYKDKPLSLPSLLTPGEEVPREACERASQADQRITLYRSLEQLDLNGSLLFSR